MSTSQDANDFRYSFSGADCTASAFFPGGEVIAKKIDKAKLYYTNYIGSKEQRLKSLDLLLKRYDARIASIDAATPDQRPLGAYDPGTIDPKRAKAVRFLTRLRNEKNPISEEVEGIKADLKSAQESIQELEALRKRFAAGAYAQLDSMATISISIHEPKGIARKLGHRNICGLARSVRVIAGTMIFTVVERHPLVQLMELDPQNLNPNGIKRMRDWDQGVGHWAAEGKSWIRTPTDLAPFNLLLTYMSEYSPVNNEGKISGVGSAANLMLENVEFISNGFVTSVNDMVSEISLQFIAGNIFELATPDQTSDALNPVLKLIEDYNFQAQRYLEEWREGAEGTENEYPDPDTLIADSGVAVVFDILDTTRDVLASIFYDADEYPWRAGLEHDDLSIKTK